MNELEVFVVVVGYSWVERIEGGSVILGTRPESAKRFNRSEAEEVARIAKWQLEVERIFVAHHAKPNVIASDDGELPPKEFVVAIGRLYLKNIRNGVVHTAFTIEDAGRFDRSEAEEKASDVREKYRLRHDTGRRPLGRKKATVYIAHELSPFFPAQRSTCSDDSDDE